LLQKVKRSIPLEAVLEEPLGDQAERPEPHGSQNAEQRSEGTEGRTLMHGSKGFSGRAPENFDIQAVHPSRPSGGRRMLPAQEG
jgi:hypothetical protein